jgi:hypothetical protein
VKFNQTGWNELFTSHRSVDFTIATNAGRHSRCDGPAMLQSIADFFYLCWYLVRSLFKSRGAEQARIDDEDQGHSRRATAE